MSKEDLKIIEEAGRVSHKSEDKITEDSYEKFISMLMKMGHTSVLEHRVITVDILTSRNVSHELIRHRHTAVTEESQRYVLMNGGVVYIKPWWWDEGTEREHKSMAASLNASYLMYCSLISQGLRPEDARQVLPGDVATELYLTANYREWLSILQLRCDKPAWTEMRRTMKPILREFIRLRPEVFSCLGYLVEGGEL